MGRELIMSTADKLILGALTLCVVTGVAQNISTKKEKPDPNRHTVKKERADHAAPTRDSLSHSETAPRAAYTHKVHLPVNGNFSRSRHAQRMADIGKQREVQENPSPEIQHIDCFSAREGLKDILFSDSYEGTLSEEEKWKLIDSGNLPW